MTGILVALLLSWILLYLIEKKNLLALGFLPPSKRSKQFLSGFILSALLCTGIQYLESFLRSAEWMLNPDINVAPVLQAIWWDFKSVFTEELIFRGAILYILIQRIGSRKAVLLSAACFGVYHWFSFGIIGNIIPMIAIFIGTGLTGYVWALAFAKTKSMLLPLGLHLGWNMVQNTVFSNGPLGELLLISQGGNELTGWISLIHFMAGMIVVPLIQLLYVKYLVRDEKENNRHKK